MAAGPELAGPRRPRMLVTGFGPFPGAPENPTEALIDTLASMPRFAGRSDLRFEVLPVEYEAVPLRLELLGSAFNPDIAVHFGLSARAVGFTLERIARNEIAAETPDNSGALRAGGPICAGAGDCASTLPLNAIHEALAARGLPVAWSDNAGGYLCNFLFYLSRSAECPGFAPSMSGFIHVPPLDAGILTFDDLKAGAVAIIETCASVWSETAVSG